MTISISLISCVLLIALTSAVIGMDLHLYTKRLSTLVKKLRNWEHQIIPRHRTNLRLEELRNLKESVVADNIETILIGSETLVRAQSTVDLFPLLSTPKDNEGRNLVLKVIVVLSALFGALLEGPDNLAFTIIPIASAFGALWILTTMKQEALNTKSQCAGLLNTWVCTISTTKGHVIEQSGQTMDESHMQELLQRELNPILTKILDLSSDTSEQTAAFIENASNAQVEGIQKLIAEVQSNLELALGNSITDAADRFAETVTQQQESMERFQASVSSVSAMLEGMKGSSEVLGQAATQLSQSTEPITKSAAGMLQVADRLQQTLSLFEGATSTYAEANTAMQQSHSTLQRGTEAYLEAGATARDLLSELRETHELASQRISAGVDEAILGSMREAGTQLQNLQSQQVESLGQWQRAAEQLESVVSSIQQSTSDMSSVATVLRESTEPTVTASSAFLEAAQTLGSTMPQIEQAALAHEHARQAMETTAQMLAESSRGYTESTTLIREAVDGFQAAQVETMAQVQANLENYAATALVSASEKIQEATNHFELQSQNASQHFHDHIINSCQRLQETTQSLEGVMTSGTESLQTALEDSHGLFEERFEAVANTQLNHMTDTAQQLGATLGQLSSELNSLTETQTRQAESWTTIMSGLNNGLQSMEQSTGSLSALIKNIEALLEPTATAASDFKSASENLTAVFPNIEHTSAAYSQLNESLASAAQALDNSGQAYVSTEQSMQTLLGEVQSTMATQTIQTESWASMMNGLNNGLQSIEQSTGSLGALVNNIEALMGPTATAANDFKSASENLTVVFPNIEHTSAAYSQLNESLASAAQALDNSGQAYASTERSMKALLGEVQSAMNLQKQSSETIANTLDSAASTVQSFAPIAEQLQDASSHVLEISSQTATAVERIRDATSAQQDSVETMSQMSQQVLQTLSTQAESLNDFSAQIQMLHQLLTAGVEAFSTALPTSVDQTLMRFDVALGEGVARLGSAVERLREAMDDLIERVESMLDNRRRK